MCLSLNGVLPLGELGALSLLLQRETGGVPGGQGLAHGAGLLGAEVQRDVLLALVQLAQVLLRLGVHHDVHPGDGLADDADLGQLGGSSTGDLGHAQVEQLSLELLELLGQLLLVLGPQFRALDLHLKAKRSGVNKPSFDT